MTKWIAVTALLFTGWANAQAQLETDLPLKYLVQVGSGSGGAPLVIFLHGYGSNEADLFDLKDHLVPGYTYLSVRAPLTLQEGSYQWFRKKPESAEYDGMTADLASSEALITELVKAAEAKYHTPPDKVVVVGFSQGAMMSYEFGLRHPDLVRGIAPLSGRILSVLHSQLKPASGLEHLAVFIGHGTADDRVPFSGASESAALLKTLSINPQFHSYAGMGHSISEAEVNDLKNWLEQTLGAGPA